MARRGPRGDLSREQVLAAADALVAEKGTPDAVSLRMVAGALGVTANALYTYVDSLDDVFHDLADQRLARLDAVSLLGVRCRHCALTTLFERAHALYASPGTLALLKRQPALGPHSFRLSETVMTLCEGGRLSARDAHDLIMGWFYGSASLLAEGWTSGTDRLRAAGEWRDDFPRVAGRPDADPAAQFAAILAGLGIAHVEPAPQPEPARG